MRTTPKFLSAAKKSEINQVVLRMETALSSLDSWFRANGLKVNATKTQLMLLGSPQNLRTLNNITVTHREHVLSPQLEAKKKLRPIFRSFIELGSPCLHCY